MSSLLPISRLQTSVPELMEMATKEEAEGGETDVDCASNIELNDAAISGSDAKDIVRRVESEILTLGKHKMAAPEIKTEIGLHSLLESLNISNGCLSCLTLDRFSLH